jgi:hypothetical protein
MLETERKKKSMRETCFPAYSLLAEKDFWAKKMAAP